MSICRRRAATSDGGRPARGTAPGLRGRRAPVRAAAALGPVPGRPRPRNRAGRGPALDRQTRGGTAACGCPHRAGLLRPAIVSASSAEGSAPTFSATTSSRRPQARTWRHFSSGRYLSSRPRATTLLFTSHIRRAGNRRFAWAPGRHSGGVRASLYPCTAGGLSTLVDVRHWRLVSLRRHDRRIGTACLARRARVEAGRDQFFRAYRAWSLAKLGQFDEARAIVAVARAEQEERGGGRCSRT